MDLQQLLAQLRGLGPLSVTGQPGAYSSEALQRLMPGARIQARQSSGHLGGDAAGFYDDPSQGYDVFQTVGDGRYLRGGINPDGTFGDLREVQDSDNIFDKVGNFALDLGPALVLAAATYGAGGLAGLSGGGTQAAGGHFGGLSAGAAGQTGLTAGAAGATGLTAPAGYVLAPQLGAAAGAGAGAGGYFAGLDPNAAGTGLRVPTAPGLDAMGGAQGLTPASVSASAPASVLASVPASAAAAVPGAKEGSSLLSSVLSAARSAAPYASLVGPAASLIQGVTAQQPQMPQNADARVPGLEAPPEARGLDRQAARAPILDVLGRNRRNNRNGTMLTGPGGVNMSSVRVGGNTLLGM